MSTGTGGGEGREPFEDYPDTRPILSSGAGAAVASKIVLPDMAAASHSGAFAARALQ